MAETATELEHPSFTRARSLPEPWHSHFPKSPAEARDWTAFHDHKALSRCVMAVARTRVECKWAAYIDAVPGMNHDNEYAAVLDHGDKLREDIARAIFPQFEGVPYAR